MVTAKKDTAKTSKDIPRKVKKLPYPLNGQEFHYSDVRLGKPRRQLEDFEPFQTGSFRLKELKGFCGTTSGEFTKSLRDELGETPSLGELIQFLIDHGGRDRINQMLVQSYVNESS